MAGGDRSTADAALLAGLIAGKTIAASAEAASMSERTGRRRLADPAFRAELDQARREIVVAGIASLAGLLELAVSTQRALLEQDAVPANVKRQVAHDVERAIAELGQGRDVEERLEQIEQRLGLPSWREEAAA
jgi:hypothetical protein